MRRLFVVSLCTLLAYCFALDAHSADWEKYDQPVPTRVVVRVLSHGAKAMNQHTGAVVVIRDAATGELLDKGDVQGATGDTTALMRVGYPRIRGNSGLTKGARGMMLGDKKAEEKAKQKGWRQPDPYYDVRDTRAPEELAPMLYESEEEAAKFETVLKLTKPTQVVIEAHGPLMPHHAGGTALATTWLFPGEDVTGEGIVLTLRGLIVDAQASLKESEVGVEAAKEGIEVPFFMRMMCGCPIAKGGMFGIPWEAEGYKITTQAYYKGKLYHEAVTTSDKLITGTSQFVTTAPLPDGLPEGKFSREQVKIRIMAAQPELANYGMDEFSVFLKRD